MEYFDTPNHSVEHMTIQFTDDAISKIRSMDDFYNATGLADIIKELGVTNVDQIMRYGFLQKMTHGLHLKSTEIGMQGV